PYAVRGIRLLLLGTLGGFLLLHAPELQRTLVEDWRALLFWVALAVIVNMFPVPAIGGQLALDMPILMAVAFLYQPPVAAALAFIAALDVREFKGEVSVGRALFNRSQVALSVLVASLIFGATDGDVHRWPYAVAAAGAALMGSYVTNVALVSTYTSLRQGTSWLRSMQGLTIGRSGRFLAVYLGSGAISLVVARLFIDIGPWPVALLIAPILIARQTLVRERELEKLANALRDRERLLERLSDRIVDERRDERLRLAADLHDDLLQTLTHTWMFSTLLPKEFGANSKSKQDLEHVVEGSKASLETLRNIIRSLQASAVGRDGLVPSLDALVRDLRLTSGMNVRFRPPPGPEIPSNLQLVVYQLAREALLNAVRHSRAGKIEVSLSVERGLTAMEVSDDGEGFDPAAIDASEHFGIGLMRERARMAGGTLEIASLKGQGTIVRTRLPISEREDDTKG
ncbi:MAG TPA: sensor histidine kinase, partial [Actinomycetota bacterium]|nr:sensor histidine kinase [Actinomycetota bacterium]